MTEPKNAQALRQPNEAELAYLVEKLRATHIPPVEFRPWLIAWANAWYIPHMAIDPMPSQEQETPQADETRGDGEGKQ